MPRGRLQWEEPKMPLMHGSTARTAARNSFEGAARCEITEPALGNVAGLLTTSAPFFASEKKEEQRFVGLSGSVVGVGPLVVQRLLEVLPFCSKSTGSGSVGGLFPLPTS